MLGSNGMSQLQKIAVLGAGNWGTAIASLLAENGHQISLWCHENEVAHDINRNHRNTAYCSEFLLSTSITATTSLKEAVQDATWIFEAVPVKFLRTIVQQAKHHAATDATWVVLSKGIEVDTLMFPTQIITDVLGDEIKTVVFGGPTFAKELMQKQLSAASIASIHAHECTSLAALLNNDYFTAFVSSDPMGVQIGGAVKNVIALRIGIATGSGYKNNTTAYLLTKALEEMATLVQSLGGQSQTVYGLSGLGDMILTCTGSLSKNLKAGRLIAQGYTMAELTREFGTLPEGINTVQSIHQLINRLNLDLPLCKATYDMIKTMST